ncbi:response regulator [Paenibacillus sp. P25]|nr:response regulator [Paenibacillus sp. P25]
MKKVLLVDDEILVREGIRDRISWESEGFIYSGDAPDGEMAAPMIERMSPDIVLTDIKMPFMDGLQLSKIVKERMPWIKIIILSGHDEFNYAREALRIGVEEYCLKPISSVELLKTLHQVSEKIDVERQEKKELEALQLKATVNRELFKDQSLTDLCTGAVPTTEAIQAAEALQIPLIAGHYLVIITEFEPKPEAGLPLTPVLEEEPIFGQIRMDLSGSLHLKRSKKEHVWIVKGDHPEDLEQSARRLLRNVKKLEETRPYVVYVGIGRVKNRVQEISGSYSEADQNKSYQRFLKNRPMTGPEWQGLQGYDRNKVTNFLKYGDASQTGEFVRGYLPENAAASPDPTYYWHYLILDMVAAVTQYIHESGGDVKAFLQEMEPVEERLLGRYDLEDIRSCAASILKLAFKYRDQFKDKYSDLLSKAKDYIAGHFDKPDISLQSVAAYVNVSPSHFSGVFSQATGQTFIDYLIKTRIKRAMESLKTTNLKSYEIAAMVGYNDPHYFNSVFKKVTGVTTKVFRNQA